MAEGFSTRQLNVEIKKELSKDKKSLILESTEKLDSIMVGLDNGVEVTLKGDAGDFVASLNNGASIEIKGNVGRYVGDNMTSGEIIVWGTAKDGVGFGTYNGTIVVHGDAGNAVGQLNKGGTIIVDGNIKNLSGLYMLNGDIIVNGNAGEDTGEWMIGGTIYVAGDFQAGTNASEHPLTDFDRTKLNDLFQKYKIEASADDFVKIQPRKLRPFYGKEEGRYPE